jgi:hypothetical protein
VWDIVAVKPPFGPSAIPFHLNVRQALCREDPRFSSNLDDLRTGLSLTQNETQEMIPEVDVDRNDQIEFTELRARMSQDMTPQEIEDELREG